MEKFLSSYKENKKIFLGDTDSYTVVQNGYTEDELIFKIKMATLLYDVVFIPAAYMWQSEQMKEVMYKIQPLILTENVLPIIRKSKETRDIKDYFEKRQNETKDLKNKKVFEIPSLATEIADSDDRKDMLFLNRMNCCLHLEEKSVKEEFIDLWKNDLSNNTDINAISMILYRSNIDSSLYKVILHELKNDVDYENFSRSTLIDHILKLNISQNVKLMFQERISWLYLRANARASQSDFYISKSAENKLVYKANVEIYIELLKNFGINKSMIQSLSVEELLRIKYSPEYLNFIISYNNLVENIYYEQSNIVKKTNKHINAMLLQENIKRRIWSKLSAIYGISGTIFIGLIVNYFSGSDINNIALGVSGGAAISSYILKKLEIINNSISSTSFYDFKEFIIKEEYKKKMQRSINGVIL
ncbi:hypothetical protein [Velocimicrobium porci]|uniref:Uncharacterized protein n=1 Tax=Velocimicrobium porci TaxID=2606634 RepID=A0A6L5Y1R5_9FIRM|nr:hypothetical protein [Velocimicrobium porci]MSS64864.1 hypothetical protein [Velocimicrobium porci]